MSESQDVTGMACLCPRDGRRSRISSSPSRQRHSTVVLATSSPAVVVPVASSVMVVVQALPCWAKSFVFPPVLGQVVDSQQESEQESE